MLKIKQLKFSYGSGFSINLDELSLSAGESLFLMGKSASGKTTFLSLVSAQLRVDSGLLSFDGKELKKLSESEARALRLEDIALIQQGLDLIEYLDVLENILLPVRLNPNSKVAEDFIDRAQGLLEKVGLEGYGKRKITELSQGERQRIAICRALILKPKLLLADEATASLDPENASLVMNLLLELSREENSALIVVSHDHSFKDLFDSCFDFDSLEEGEYV